MQWQKGERILLNKKLSKSKRLATYPGALSPVLYSCLKGMESLVPLGETKIIPLQGLKIFGVFEISSDAFLSKALRIVNTFPLIASPQILSRGNTAFSIRVCFIPCLDKNMEAEQPAGPAPEIIISENSSLNSKAAKKMKRSMLFLLNFFCS